MRVPTASMYALRVALCLAASAAAGPTAAPGACPAVGAEKSCGDPGDEAVLLQRLRAERAELATVVSAAATSRSQAVQSGKRAVAYEGGGWLAMTAYAGLMAGMSSVVDPQGPVTDILKEFEIISSTSGGSWLSLSMAYSESFLTGLQDMKDSAGSNPERAVELWSLWLQALTAKMPVCSFFETVRYLLLMTKRLISLGYSWDHSHIRTLTKKQQGAISESTATLSKGSLHIPGFQEWREACQLLHMDWSDTVVRMLDATAKISPQATFADNPHNPWVEGKTLIQTMTIPSRTEWNTTYEPMSNENHIDHRAVGEHLLYAPHGSDVPQYIPAKVAWTVGEDTDKQPKRSFCAEPKCFNLEFEYKLHNGDPGEKVAMAPVFQKAMVDQVGKLPLTMVAAASSAFDSVDDVAHAPSFMTVVLGEGAIWATRAENGETFADGKEVNEVADTAASDVALKLAAGRAMFPLADGANSDPLGIAQAIAAGATDIVSLQTAWWDSHPLDSAVFSAGGAYGVGPLFADYTEEEFLRDFNTTARRTAGPEGSNVVNIKWFQKELETVDNRLFGINAGIAVRLTCVFVHVKDITIGPPTVHLEAYGPMMRDIIIALRMNETFTRELAAQFRA